MPASSLFVRSSSWVPEVARPSKAFLVIAAWRPSSSTLNVDKLKNILVLDRKKMAALYGETLSSFITLAETNENFAAISKSRPL